MDNSQCSIRARDLMTEDVVALSSDDTLSDAANTLLTHQISGAPVVDENNRVIGVISEFELLDLLFDSEIGSTPVSQFLERETYVVDEDDPATKIVHLFALHRIRRLPVVRGEQLVGVVSRRDLLQYAAKSDGSLQDSLRRSSLYEFDDHGEPAR